MLSSKEKILKSAAELFHRQGIHATGLDQILRSSKTGKGQFYHFFKDKDDLIRHVLAAFREKASAERMAALHPLEEWKDLDAWFGFFIAMQKSNGCTRSCPIATIAAELSGHQAELRDEACAVLDLARRRLAEFFERMRKQGELARSHQPEALADFCFSVLQGGLLVSKIRRDSTPFEHAARHALRYIHSLRKA